MPRVPTTLLEQAAEKFWNFSMNRAVSGASLFQEGGPGMGAWLKVLKGYVMPSRNFLGRLADRGEEVALQSASRGEVPQSHADWAVGQMREARQAMGRLDDHLLQRRMFLNQLDLELQYFMSKHNLKPTDDAWLNIRRDLEGGVDSPVTRDLGAIMDRSRDMMGRFWNERESKLAAGFNRMPVIVDPTKVANRPQAFQADMDQLVEVILREPEMQDVLREAMVRPGGAALVHSEVSDFIRGLVTHEMRGTFRKPHGLVRSPHRILARRSLKNVPEGWRLHPFQEVMVGLHDEFSYIADANTLGRDGRYVQSVISWLRGDVSAADVMNLSPEARKQLDQYQDLLGRAPEHSGRLQRDMADMLEQLARATTGQQDESAWVLALRQGFAPAGAVSMMAFSAIPNMSQATAELIVRDWSAFAKAFFRGGVDREKARMMGILTGQHNASMLLPDASHTVAIVNEKLLKMGGTKKPTAIFQGEWPSILDPRWWWANFSILEKYGLRGMRAAAEEFLHANGFAGVEDWLRRGAIVSVQDEVPRIQAALQANRNDGWALRRMRAYGVDDPEQFLSMRLPTDPDQARRAFWAGDIDDALKIQDWQRSYFHGVGQTQFNYLPGDFPMIFAHPYFGSVGLQFRRFAYSQASKVVSHVLNEASAGNPKPLLYMAASAMGGGEIVRRIRNSIGMRDIAHLGGTEFVTGEEPVVGRAKEVRTPFGVISVNERRQLENLAAMGLMGVYTDAFLSLAEDKPMLLAAWGFGVFPAEMFNLVSKMTQAVSEVSFGAEPTLGYGRFTGPKVQEATRQVVREVPFFGRLISPHVRWGRSRYQRLREFGMRSFLSGDFDTFNRIQKVMVDDFYSPITMDDVVNRMYRQALKEAGYAGVVPRPGDPGYLAYRSLAEREGRARPKRPVRGAEFERAQVKAQEEQQEFFSRFPTEEE